MNGAHVLIVEADRGVRRVLNGGLRGRGYSVVAVESDRSALASLRRRSADIILLDPDFLDPDLQEPGDWDAYHALQCRSRVPIIVLSACADESDKVRALERGADDYVTKPFGVEEVLARVRVALRHATGGRTRAEVTFNGGVLRIDFEQRRVWRGERELPLTAREYDLLKVLACNPDSLITREELSRAVWDGNGPSRKQYLRRYITRLRRKLEDDPARPRYIFVEDRLGYSFCPSDARANDPVKGVAP